MTKEAQKYIDGIIDDARSVDDKQMVFTNDKDYTIERAMRMYFSTESFMNRMLLVNFYGGGGFHK